MKALVQKGFGSPDVLALREIPKPALGEDRVLVRVRGASLNAADWHMMHRLPQLIGRLAGIPKSRVRGGDLAGVVEAVGSKVTGFHPGDEVFGVGTGSFAEYATAPEKGLAPKPRNLTFEQAAAIPVAGLTALQGLRKGNVQSGQKVLVNGAAGGVGTFAVQIAKSMGAQVTGVCSGGNVEMVTSIGAEKVIDYTHQDFAKDPEQYDVIFECVGNKSFAECRAVLTENGKFFMIGGPHDISLLDILTTLIKAKAMSAFSKQKAPSFIAKSNQADLTQIGEMIVTGKIAPIIDRRYKLAETPEAIRYLEAGHARGKVLILVAD